MTLVKQEILLKKNNPHKIIVVQEKVLEQHKVKCKQANSNIKYNNNKNNYYKNFYKKQSQCLHNNNAN
jgi:hypothetical protein